MRLGKCELRVDAVQDPPEYPVAVGPSPNQLCAGATGDVWWLITSHVDPRHFARRRGGKLLYAGGHRGHVP